MNFFPSEANKSLQPKQFIHDYDTRLETLAIEIDEGKEHDRREALNATHVLELLESLRELRVTKEVKITGLINDHSQYLQDIKNSMLLPEVSGPPYNESRFIQNKKTILGICLDFQTYVRTFRRIVDSWDDGHINKKSASLRDLAQILPRTTENWEQPDPVEILPGGITNDIIQREIPKALARIERYNMSITNQRLRRIAKNAPFDQMTDAYNRL